MYFGGDMVERMKGNVAELDKEWIQLIMEARVLGIDINMVKEFLREENERNQHE
jgi:DNA-binding transcriptional MerR regulator